MRLGRPTSVALAAVAAFSLSAAAQADVLVSSTFDADTDNWSFINDGSNLHWVPDVGNPAGSLKVLDNARGLWIYFAAPEKFHGDLSVARGGTLRYDVNPTFVNADDTMLPDLKLSGGGIDLHWYEAAPVQGQWNEYVISLDPGSFVKADGQHPTDEEFDAVLSDVSALQIRGEYNGLGDECVMLDNVIITVPLGTREVPEPASLGMLGLGSLMLLRRRRS